MEPIKKVIYLPTYREQDYVLRNQLRSFRLTINREYDVYAEEPQSNHIGMVYTIKDDAGKKLIIVDDHFVNAKIVLVGDENVNWNGEAGQMPEVRSRKLYCEEEKAFHIFSSTKTEPEHEKKDKVVPPTDAKFCYQVRWGDDQ